MIPVIHQRDPIATVKRPVENGVEITSQHSRDRRINTDRNIVKELITCWVTIRSVDTLDTKNVVAKTKFTHQKSSIWLRP